jgi:hypothetical protein
MKIKNLIFILLIGTLLSGLVTAGFISVHDKEEVSEQINQNQFQIPENYNAASVSKEAILLLLAVGVIGILGISRKKRELGGPAQRNGTKSEAYHQNPSSQKKSSSS